MSTEQGTSADYLTARIARDRRKEMYADNEYFPCSCGNPKGEYRVSADGSCIDIRCDECDAQYRELQKAEWIRQEWNVEPKPTCHNCDMPIYADGFCLQHWAEKDPDAY